MKPATLEALTYVLAFIRMGISPEIIREGEDYKALCAEIGAEA